MTSKKAAGIRKYTAQMSPEELAAYREKRRGKPGKRRRRTKREVPAQLDHGNGRSARRRARRGEKKMQQDRKRRTA